MRIVILYKYKQQQTEFKMTTKEANKAQYRAQLEQYIYMTKAAAIRLDNEIWRDLLTIRERIDIWKATFE